MLSFIECKLIRQQHPQYKFEHIQHLFGSFRLIKLFRVHLPSSWKLTTLVDFRDVQVGSRRTSGADPDPSLWGRSFCKKKITNFLDPPLKNVIRWESLEVKVATWTIIKFYKPTASNFTGQEISGTNEPLWHHWANRKPLTVHHQRLPLIKWNFID